jgi:hypothetical protein
MGPPLQQEEGSLSFYWGAGQLTFDCRCSPVIIVTSYCFDFGLGFDYEASCDSLDSILTDYTVGRPGFECR